MIKRQTSLSKNIVQFCMFLRQKDFNVGVEEEAATLQALQYVNYNSNKIFLLALKAILCRSKTQLDEFDNLFYEYWKELENIVNAKRKDDVRRKPPQQEASFKSLKAWLHGNRNNDTAAEYEALKQNKFS